MRGRGHPGRRKREGSTARKCSCRDCHGRGTAGGSEARAVWKGAWVPKCSDGWKKQLTAGSTAIVNGWLRLCANKAFWVYSLVARRDTDQQTQ
jgi:hypothetical protein